MRQSSLISDLILFVICYVFQMAIEVSEGRGKGRGKYFKDNLKDFRNQPFNTLVHHFLIRKIIIQ